MLTAVFLVRALTGDIALVDLPNAAQDLVTLTVSVMIESLGFVILGILISVLVQVWIPDRWIVKVLPRNGAARRVVISVLGVLLPVCECGNVPLSRGLIAKGFSVPEAMTFLVAAPIVNPVTILTTYQVFGFTDGILVSRIVGGFLIANLVGWLFSQHPTPGKLLTEKFAAECALPPRLVPSARGAGLASSAVSLALEHAALRGATIAAADTGADNAASRRVLIKGGLAEVGRRGSLVLYERVLAAS